MKFAAAVLALAALALGSGRAEPVARHGGRHRRRVHKLAVFGDSLSEAGTQSDSKDGGFFDRIRAKFSPEQLAILANASNPIKPTFEDTFSTAPGPWPTQIADATGLKVINYAVGSSLASRDRHDRSACALLQTVFKLTPDDEDECKAFIPGAVSQAQEYIDDVKTGRQRRLRKHDIAILAFGANDANFIGQTEVLPLLRNQDVLGALAKRELFDSYISELVAAKKLLETLPGAEGPQIYFMSIPTMKNPFTRRTVEVVPGAEDILELFIEYLTFKLQAVFGADRVIDLNKILDDAVDEARENGLNVDDSCMGDQSLCNALFCAQSVCLPGDLSERFWLDDIHPGAIGHKFIADAVMARLDL